MEASKKPHLAILIGQALAKKGRASMPKDESDDMPDDQDQSDTHVHQIASELLEAIEEKNVDRLKDLLLEVIELSKQ
jgi:hypothetical protein